MSFPLPPLPPAVAQARHALLTRLGTSSFTDFREIDFAPHPPHAANPTITTWIRQQHDEPQDFYEPDARADNNWFGGCCAQFLEECLPPVLRWRPATWEIQSGTPATLSRCQQYAHWSSLAQAAMDRPALAPALAPYTVGPPDLLLLRYPHKPPAPVLHAALMTYWKLQGSDVADISPQARALQRERRGRAPHLVLLTGELTPSYLASIALGTGDLDCTYHFALYELQAAVAQSGNSEAEDLIGIMVEGKRLKDISDLPLDLAV